VPRTLSAHLLAGTYHNDVDLPVTGGALARVTAPGVVIRVERRDPGGLQIVEQYRGFVYIYGHLGPLAPSIDKGQCIVHAREKFRVVGTPASTAARWTRRRTWSCRCAMWHCTSAAACWRPTASSPRPGSMLRRVPAVNAGELLDAPGLSRLRKPC
jgi:hypothetical protein